MSLLNGIDFGNLEQKALTIMKIHNGQLWLDELYSDAIWPLQSELEQKFHSTIDNLWGSFYNPVYSAYYTALARKPETKDLFKSKCSAHCFPWYHRNRKY